MSLSKSSYLTHAQTPVPCNACEDEVPGEYYCIECKQTLCPQCEKFHRKFTKDHNVVLRSQVGDVHTKSMNCADHGDKVTVHCENCNIPVCIKCVTGKHQGHKMVDIKEIFEHKIKLLQYHIDEIEEFLPKLERKRKDIELEKEAYEMKVLQISKDMEAENQFLHKELDRHHYEGLKSLHSIRQSHLLIFDSCTTEIDKKKNLYEKRKSEYQDVIATNSVSVVINFVQNPESLPQIKSKPELQELPSFVPGNIQKISENLGKLQLSHPPLVVKPLKQTTPIILSKFKFPGGIPCICLTKEGDVWLGGIESRELVLVNIKGQILMRRKVQNRTHSLAVMDSGDIIVNPHPHDSSLVSRLLVDGSNKHVFNTKPVQNVGVSVTADQQILICIKEGRVVRANSDGTNVMELYKGPGEGSAVRAVEYVDGNIYISDRKTPAIVIVNNSGNVISTITHTTRGQKFGWPLGLVVDKMGNILCADKENHCVYIMDQNKQVMELVGRSYNIQQPRHLAVDNDNNLWITQVDGTVHVVKYLA